MKVNKIIEAKETINIDIKEVTLLTVDEAKALTKDQRKNDFWWWLRSPGSNSNRVAIVNRDGEVDAGGDGVSDHIGVRPALRISIPFFNLQIGDIIEVFGERWTVINGNLALCNNLVGNTCFRNEWEAEDANDYKNSDIKKWLEDWVMDRKK